MVNYFIRLIKSRLRLFYSILFGVLVGLIISYWADIPLATRLIISFNSGMILYLILAFQIMIFMDEKEIVRRAASQEEGKILVLFLVLFASTVSLITVVAELSRAKELSGILKLEHIALASLTIMVSWIFTHMMFAIHYAHEYYLNLAKKKPAGLEFPGNELPFYADFFYLAISIGTSGQTADVGFSERKMRRAGMVHCMFSFFFNTTILALTINLMASLF
jgi:uncharacterized membrane protein